MNAKTTIAAALLALAAGQAAYAQEAIPANNWTNSALSQAPQAQAPVSTKSRAQVQAEIPAGLPSAFADSYPARGTSHRPFTSKISRAEVLADLQIWQESGLAALNRGDDVPVFNEAYARAEAKYAELRNSPYYATLVQRIANARGERVDVAAQ